MVSFLLFAPQRRFLLGDSIEDLSWLRAIDGLAIVVPADPAQTRAAVRWAANSGLPSYLRIGRTKTPSVSPDETKAFAFGKADIVRQGSSLTIVATGILVSRTLEAAEALSGQGIDARVINVSTIKPIDEGAIIAAARETRAIVTAEEATTEGGLGAAVAEIVVRHAPVPMRILGVKGFAPTGSASYLLDHFGLNRDGIVAAALEIKRH